MKLLINGNETAYSGAPGKPLLWVIRDDAGLMGTKFGCGTGICGACTVHVDGKAQLSCRISAEDVAGRNITTIEGLAGPDGGLHPLQKAWIAHDVGQCGFCQPGMLMALSAERSSADPITNLCRCATYARVRRALTDAKPSEPARLLHREQPVATADEHLVSLGEWVRIGLGGTVRIGVSQSEMGQGALTGLAMIVAEELDADWGQVVPEIVTGSDAHRIELLGYHGQFVGGSLSTTLLHDRLRDAGARARRALVAAAAHRWGADPDSCVTADSLVQHPATGRSLAYHDLAEDAALLWDESPVARKPADSFRLLRSPLARVDQEAHLRGRSVFGADVRVPDMLIGAIRYAGGFGAKLTGLDETAARALPGVVDVVRMDDAVIVLADSYLEAEAGAAALVLEVDTAAGAGLTTGRIFAANRAALDQAEAVIAVDTGAAGELLNAAGANVVRAEFDIPYIAHATIETVVATVYVEDGRATAWVPTQGQDVVRDRLSKLFGMPEEAVTVHTTFVGGGFGRKFVPDFVIQAALASKACGRPVQLIRSRAEDMRHDFYRPGLVARFEAAVDAEGWPVALRARIAGQSLLYQMFPMWVVNGVDDATVEGTNDQPYAIANLRVEMVDVPQIVPMGFLRSVGRSANVFFVESLIDQLAGRVDADPVAYRRHLLRDDPRAIAVIDRAVEGHRAVPPAPGRFRGFAYAPYIGRGGHYTTRVAATVDISLDAAGAVAVERVAVVIDPGLAVNPNIVRAQVEGCVGFALSSVIRAEITMTDGLVDQGDLTQFPLLTMDEMPEVEVAILEGDLDKPGGVGEATMPVIGPALAAAIHAATGLRLHSMPFAKAVPFRSRTGGHA